ncbi:MAG: XrtA/PEP-CTERM system TPR-repeat protein PrsT [Pseudomonadota bacterium]
MFSIYRKKSASHLLLALLAALVVGTAGCSKTESSQKYVQEAKTLQAKGDNKAAIIQLKNALQKDADNKEARYLLGTIYNRTGDFASAEKELRKAQQLGYEPGKIQPALARAMLGQGQFQKVLDEIKPGQDAKGEAFAGIMTYRGHAALALGKKDDAKAAFATAVNSDPAFSDAYLGAARLAAAEKNLDEALRQVELALSKSPGNADAWLMKGDVLRAQAKTEEAIAAYRQALKVDDGNVAAHVTLASIYVDAKKFDAARAEVAAARKAAPNNLVARYMEALIDFRQAKYPEARDNLQEVLKSAPEHMPSVLLYGVVAYVLGTYEQAEQNIGKFLGQFPNSAYARKMLAATQLKRGQPARALDTLNPLLSQGSKDVYVLALAGEASLQTREFSKSSDYFEKAAALDPKNVALRTQMGVSHLASGESARAIAELESVAGQDSGQYKADTILVLTHLSKQEWDKALAAIAALEKKLPNNPVVYNFRGAAYHGKKDLANARKNFERALALDSAHIAAAINLAQLDLQEKNPQAARKRFEAILAKDKNHLQAMLALANLANDEKEAVSWLERAAKSHPAALQPRRLLIDHHLRNNEPQKALAIARDAQTANPDNPDALDLLGTTQLAAGEKDNALTTYGKLVKSAPKAPLAYYRLASAQAVAKDIAAARSSLNKALELKPDYPDAQAALISLEIQAGRHAEALKIAQGIQNQSPQSPSGFVLEGDVLMAQKKYSEAAKAYEKAFAMDKNGLLAAKIHQAQSLAGDARKADAGVQQWLKDHPDDLVARGYLAQTYMKASRNRQAIEQYELVLKKDANDLVALNNLAWLYYQEKDPRALPTAERVYKLRPDAAFIGDTLGWILVEQGNTARGLEILRKAAAVAPKNPEIAYHYAVALARSGDKAKARRQLEDALASGQEFPQKEQAKAFLKQL